MDRPVLDMTGLTGRYDLTIDMSSIADGSESTGATKSSGKFATNLPRSCSQQLRSQIRARKLPTDILIIASM